MKVTKLPSGNYRCRVYVGKDASGKKMWKSITGPDKKRVELEAHKFQVERSASDCMDSSSFEEAASRFLKSHEAVLSPATVRSYKSILNSLKAKVPWFCSKSIYSLSSSDLQLFVDALVRGGVTPKTVRNNYAFVTSVLSDSGVMIRPPRLPQKARPDMYIPDGPMVKQVLEAVKGTDIEVPVMLAAFGPLRRGEICALTMDDFNGNIVHVHRDMVQAPDGGWVVKAPKTYSSDRYIELPDFVMQTIREKGYIVKCKPTQITRRFGQELKKAGLPAFHFHALRHFCISYLHSIGIADIYIMQRSGHSTANVLRSVYTHTLQDRSKTETERILSTFAKFRE